MKRILILFMLMLTTCSPMWAAELRLHVVDVQEHPIKHAKMLLNGEQEQRTDSKGYVTFEISDAVYADKGNLYDYSSYYLTYVSDDVEASYYYDEHYYTRSSDEIRVYPQDEGITKEVSFHEYCIFLNFDFTKHLSEQQRNILKGQVIKYTASTSGYRQETRSLKYNGEASKRLMFWVDKGCDKVTCQMNSDLTGNVTSTTIMPEGEIFMPATIDVNLFDGLVPLTLNSLTGIDGKPVNEGTVGLCNLAEGLPAVVRYIGPNDYNINIPCLLNGYQGFTYTCSPDKNSIDIDLKGKGKKVDLRLLDHLGKPMNGAQVLTFQSRLQGADSIIIAETDANGAAHYNRVHSDVDHIWAWYLTVKPVGPGYICPPEMPEGDNDDDDENKASVIIDYSKYHFVDLRVKNVATEAWSDRYRNMQFSVNPVDGETVYEGLATTSFYDGHDLVYRAFVDNDKIEKDITTLRLRYTVGSRYYYDYDVMPYIAEMSPIPSKDITYTISPLDWKNVQIKYSVPEGSKVSPAGRYYIDDEAFNFESYRDRNVVIMPAGTHAMRMEFSGSHTEYELGAAQDFSINSTDDEQTATYVLRPADYVGYALTVVAPDGQPAEYFHYEADGLSVRLDEEGKGAIYLANEGEHTFKINTLDIHMKPYAWKETLTKGVRNKAVDFSKMYQKLNVSVKTVDSQSAYYGPQLELVWAESDEALNKAIESNVYDSDGLGASYKMSISSWDNEDGSQLYTQTIYLPKGVVKGVVTVHGEDACNMPATELNGDMDYTFDYTTFGQVSFTFDGNTEKPYGSELKLYSINDQKMINTWRYGQGLLLAPGQYKACVIGFRENGDYYYVLSPSQTFTVAGGKQTVDMPSAKTEDYVNVNLNIKNANEAFAGITACSVAVMYDGVFYLTEGNNDGSYYFNTLVPWKMLKGSYDYELKFTKGDGFAYAYNIDGHVDIVDAASTFDIDMAGKHLFKSYAMTDGKGNAIDWTSMGIKPYMLEITDEVGNLICKTSTSFGLILPYGDYDVKVYAADRFIENIKTFDPVPLHVDAQSESVATFVLPEVTGINGAVSTNEMTVRLLRDGLVVESSASAPVAVAIYSASGACLKKVTASNGDVIDISAFVHGTYIVHLQQGHHKVIRKVLK